MKTTIKNIKLEISIEEISYDDADGIDETLADIDPYFTPPRKKCTCETPIEKEGGIRLICDICNGYIVEKNTTNSV